jgi:hypothetical protein
MTPNDTLTKPTAFSLDGGAGLVAGVNVLHVPAPGPCDRPLSYSHAVDLLLAMEAEAEQEVRRIWSERPDARRPPERLAGPELVAMGASEAEIGARLGEAAQRLDAIRECATRLIRHQRLHSPADVAAMLTEGGAQLELDTRLVGWDSLRGPRPRV